MKKKQIKKLFNLSWLIIAALLTFSACSDDDDDDDNGNDILVEDGYYLSGTATGLDGLVLDGLLMQGREEGDEFASLERTGMYEKFMYLVPGSFNLVVKAGANETTYGIAAGTAGTLDLDGTNDQINATVDTGKVAVDGEDFTISTAGLYHIVFDMTTEGYYIIPVESWGIIGDATDEGWSGEYDMNQISLDATSGEWEITDLTLRETGGFKFRYGDGWKVSSNFIIFTNIGKDSESNDFMMGGGTFPYPSEGEGAYTVTLTWSLADGFAYSTERTGDVDPLPEYPEELYMIGDALNLEDGDSDGTPDGWQWDLTDAPMVPVHSKPHLFWKVVWLNTGGSFKFSPVQDWNGDFGMEEGTDGEYSIGSNNLPAPDVTGYYMVVVDLDADSIFVAEPEVYLIGDCVDSWDTADPDALFTVDNANEIVTFSGDLLAGDIRMYAWSSRFTDWWQSEFIILSNEIVFRGTGDDQERVNLSAGTYKIDLNFKTGAGSIVAQ